MKEGDRVLGIDPGTGRLGWAILSVKLNQQNSKEIEITDCGLIETKTNQDLSERLVIIYNKICEVIKKYQPNETAIEELFFVKNVKTGIAVAHARGVAILAAKLSGMKIFEYKPNEIKLNIAGYGHATKDQMQKMLKCHIKNCDIKQDDTVDAVAVALTHLHRPKYSLKG